MFALPLTSSTQLALDTHCIVEKIVPLGRDYMVNCECRKLAYA